MLKNGKPIHPLPGEVALWHERASQKDAVLPTYFEIHSTKVVIECASCKRKFQRNRPHHLIEPVFICPTKTCRTRNWMPIRVAYTEKDLPEQNCSQKQANERPQPTPEKLAEWRQLAGLKNAIVPHYFEVFMTKVVIECGQCNHRFQRPLIPNRDEPIFVCPANGCRARNWIPVWYS